MHTGADGDTRRQAIAANPLQQVGSAPIGEGQVEHQAIRDQAVVEKGHGFSESAGSTNGPTATREDTAKRHAAGRVVLNDHEDSWRGFYHQAIPASREKSGDYLHLSNSDSQ